MASNNGVFNTGKTQGGVQNRPSPFTAQGRTYGQTQSDLDDRGLNGIGHPTSAGPWQAMPDQQMGQYARPGGTRNQGIAQLAQSIGSLELSNQDNLYEFMSAYQKLLNYMAISAKLAQGQLKAAARAQARQTSDGWMTPAQRVKLGNTLRRVGKDIDSMADNCVDAVVCAVKGWRRFETFMDDLQNDGGTFRKPGGGNKGFRLVQG